MFKNINEDNFESSDDGEEKQKNKRLENLAKVSQPTVVNKQKDEEQKTKLSQDDEDPQENQNNIIIGENTDILARYRIPIEKNNIDYKLQLPEDSDSSNFSSKPDEAVSPQDE